MFGIIIALIISIGIFVLNQNKKGSVDMDTSKNITTIKSNLSLQKTLKVIIKFAQNNGYKVDDFDESKGVIILSDSASFSTNTNGYIYPINIFEKNESEVMIQIGTDNKSLINKSFLGPLGNRAHENCVNGIRTALYSEY
ncbi:hypothetical protein [Flavobacterium aciduliphilum]|uniref:Uncharacterized protein n=1 Tax=Flavobacterium aciduliphilum TaxID=1101402 RepID=A0A328YGX0_9FLAO|nr:hypothetical protein [Flavobacterium aciduliphilum]RAR72554.1 hypothetical protein CLV55_105124 [Flavobacterium aciduliphilum]